MFLCVWACVCVWLHHSGSRWLQWRDRWSCNRMKATLTLSGWLTHSQMIGSSWGAAVVAMPPPLNLWFFPIFPVFPTLSHQCPDLFSTTVRPPQRSLPSRGSFPSSPVLPSAVPGSTTSSTPPHNRWHCPSHVGLSHSTGNLHSSLTAWRQIYVLNRCFRPDLIETIQKNRPWKGKGDASLGGTHTMTPFRGIFWNGMTGITDYFWFCPLCSHESVDRDEHMPGNKAQGGTNEHKRAADLHLQMLNLRQCNQDGVFKKANIGHKCWEWETSLSSFYFVWELRPGCRVG